jgi:DNA-binding transcriptional LysR family regulator
MKIEPRDLQYFATVARRGHVGRAAVELGLSQPALSKSLRRLERALGARLVKRTPKGVDLTTVGAALAMRARALQHSLDDIVREAAELGDGSAGRVRVGASTELAMSVMPKVCAAMLEQFPKVAIKLTVATPDALTPALLNGEFDLTVMPVPPAAHELLAQEKVFAESFVVLASARHRLARRKSVTLDDVARERWVLGRGPAQEELCRIFDRHGLPAPAVAVEAISSNFRVHLLHLTNLLGYAPRRLASNGPGLKLAEIPVKELVMTRHIAVHYRKDAYLSPAARRFIEQLKSMPHRDE